MDIAQYIADLLNEHHEVSLPGIGTFYKRNVSAFYNESEGLFYPPSHKIDFKAEEGSDATLVSHIVSSKHISESSALYFIERFCENLRNSLDKESNVSLSPLGSLSKKDGGYTFEAGTQQPALEYFGLKPVKEPKVSDMPYAAEEDETLLSDRPSSGSRSVFIVLAILLLLATATGLAYYFYPQYFKNFTLPGSNKPAQKAPAPVLKRDSIQDSVSFADSIVEQLEKEGMPGAQVEEAPDTLNISTQATRPDSIKAEPKPEKVYEVIVASFGLKREAETSVRNLRRKGIDAKVVIDDKKPKFKVSIGSFTSMSAAHKENRRVQQGVNKDAWILTVTNKEK